VIDCSGSTALAHVGKLSQSLIAVARPLSALEVSHFLKRTDYGQLSRHHARFFLIMRLSLYLTQKALLQVKKLTFGACLFLSLAN
jgi:hypothetical protein